MTRNTTLVQIHRGQLRPIQALSKLLFPVTHVKHSCGKVDRHISPSASSINSSPWHTSSFPLPICRKLNPNNSAVTSYILGKRYSILTSFSCFPFTTPWIKYFFCYLNNDLISFTCQWQSDRLCPVLRILQPRFYISKTCSSIPALLPATHSQFTEPWSLSQSRSFLLSLLSHFVTPFPVPSQNRQSVPPSNVRPRRRSTALITLWHQYIRPQKPPHLFFFPYLYYVFSNFVFSPLSRSIDCYYETPPLNTLPLSESQIEQQVQEYAQLWVSSAVDKRWFQNGPRRDMRSWTS